ncbi:MAG: PilT/PilU family type 4a pilus ATPase [Pyrinomonadaceae bacterium]
MERLNGYLQQLLNANGYELHLEPNQNPYIMTAKGRVDAAMAPLPGNQINAMIFALIPGDVKQQLPTSQEVKFDHPHNLGKFTFSVRKSPSGFVVTVAPNFGEGRSVSIPDPAESPSAVIPTAPQNTTAPKPTVPAPSVPKISAPPVVAQPKAPAAANLQSQFEIEPDEFPGSQGAYETEYKKPASSFMPEESAMEFEVEYSSVPEFTDASPSLEAPAFEASVMPQPELVPAPSVEVEHTAIPKIENIEPVAPVIEPTQNQMNPIQNLPGQQTVPAQPVAQAPVKPAFTPANPKARAEMDSLFRKMAEMGASDLHLSVSMPPLVRKDGKIMQLSAGAQPISVEAMNVLLTSIMPQKNVEEFSERNDTDFAYEIQGLARFRANVFRDRKGMGGVFRIIPSDILTAETLGLSPAIMKLCELSKGLVVVTGPTGSGKSTTLCAMVDWINKNREDHIITIEDPIEFTHDNQKCLVNQREVHNHTDSFKDALRAALREDPDILLVGEMRDLETISIAIETAETGHLVFGTLHTTTAASTVDRIIDQFPADRQQQIRVMLSESLKGVIAQTLLPKIGGGRVAALEVLIVTPAIANLIREGKTFQIPSQMQTGKNLGMVMLNDALMDLVNKGLVEPKDAWIKAVDKTGFEMLLQRSGKRL